MLNPEEFREQTAAKLLAGIERASCLRAFVGMDGFVDEIIHVVDKRDNAASSSAGSGATAAPCPYSRDASVAPRSGM